MTYSYRIRQSYLKHRDFSMFLPAQGFLYVFAGIGISLYFITNLADILSIRPYGPANTIKSFALLFRYPFYFIFFLILLTTFCLCSQNIEISLCVAPPNTIKSFALYSLLNLLPINAYAPKTQSFPYVLTIGN